MWAIYFPSLRMLGAPPDVPDMHCHASPCRRLAQEWHPDKCRAERKALAEVKFKEIKDAYDQILKGNCFGQMGLLIDSG